jgi:hypothetical protein
LSALGPLAKRIKKTCLDTAIEKRARYQSVPQEIEMLYGFYLED